MDARRLALAALLLLPGPALLVGSEPDRPNILWITCEDISPNLGCYGDPYAVTPNLDRLAGQSVRYTRAYATIGVCAPARSTIITGMYPPSIGTHHMRCQGRLPAAAREFPRYLRESGYYCANNSKTDYNFRHHPATWDRSSPSADWRGRGPGQPFFAVVNFTASHESQIRLPEADYLKQVAGLDPHERHDPALAPLPPYHPDTPEVRRDWARYADMITVMDRQVGDVLRQLDEDGLSDSTIVFFYSDHGAGLPRSKRWLYESSTRVPLLIRFPERFAGLAPVGPGATTDRLVDFSDLAPTALSLAGLPVPGHMQGRAFLGPADVGPRAYVYGFRDRMDERTDMVRSAFDGRFRLIRNSLPHLPWFGGGQQIGYMDEMPTMRVWQRLADAGALDGPAARFMAPRKPFEELYDVEADPWEVDNLAMRPEHRATLERLRTALDRWQAEIVDLGYLPEADLRTRFGDRPPYDAVRESPDLYPFDRLRSVAMLAGAGDPKAATRLVDLLDDPDPAVRWWAATGLGASGRDAAFATGKLNTALDDPAPPVRVAAADALARLDRVEEALPTLALALKDTNEWVRLAAIQVLDRLDERATPAAAAIRAARGDANEYVVRVAERALETFDREP